MCSSVPLTFILTPSYLHRDHQFLSNTTLPFLSKPLTKSFICYTFSPSSNNAKNSSYEQEEARWLREEQRWLREEQRWLREEQRWTTEKDTLELKIQTLELKIQQLQGQNSLHQASLTEAVANITKLLQILKEGELGKNINRIAESGSSAIPLVMDAPTKDEKEEEKKEEKEEKVVVKEIIKVVKEEKKRKTLRNGCEGDDVQAMQEALQKLGFYSGEEDMEFSSFSSGTERAVKTWQSTIGKPEDGIMTSELLERLFMGEIIAEETAQKKPENGAPFASLTEIEHTIEKEEEFDITRNRVFLLGENRWEDSSRLSHDKNKPVTKGSCITCLGVGRVLCMECDGTGEPNIEPQFLEWVGEETKCPYCEGHGYITCDVCKGK